MIRPATLMCALLAFGSGLYLYQAKHRAQMLDRDIARVVADTHAAHERITMLTAEWQNLNELERLKGLAQQYLPVRAVLPSQTVPLAELGQHLPAPLPASAFAPLPDEPAAPATGQALIASAAPALATLVASPARPAAPPVGGAWVVAAPPTPSQPAPASGPVQVAASSPAATRPVLRTPAASPALLLAPAFATALGAAAPLAPHPALVQRVAASTPTPAASLPAIIPATSSTAIAFPPTITSALGVAAHGSLLPPPVPVR